jgi:N-acetylmuramoyl-L-alanine amidase
MPTALNRPTRRAAAVLSFALVLTVAGWIPLLPKASGAPAPATVARRVPIASRALAGPAAPGLLVGPGGSVRTTAAPGRTAPVTVCSPIWFTAVTLGWRQGGSASPVAARIAVAPRHSGFGRAQLADSNPAEGPGPSTPDYHPGRAGTELLWTGGGRCIRFTLRVPARTSLSRLHAGFVNTSGTARGPGTGPPDAAPSAAAGASGVAAASAMPARPAMVSRAQWGANPKYLNTGSPGCAAPYYNDAVKMAYVHHTSGSNDYMRAQSDDIVRAIYWYHTQSRGFCDIAYNFLIDRFGTIFVGRAGGVSRPVQPGSQMGFNPDTFSVATMGNWQTVPPPGAVVSSLERLLTWRLDVAHLPPHGWARMVSEGGSTTRYPAGTHVTLPVIAGHRDTGITDCPGDYLYRQLPAIRKAVDARGRPKIYRPRETARLVTPGSTTTTFSATASGPVTWRVTVSSADGAPYVSVFRQGEALALEWDGTDGSGTPLPPGDYVVDVEGITPAGAARPATLEVVVAGQPLPSPSPSPSPSASPTPSPTPSPTATG